MKIVLSAVMSGCVLALVATAASGQDTRPRPGPAGSLAPGRRRRGQSVR